MISTRAFDLRLARHNRPVISSLSQVSSSFSSSPTAFLGYSRAVSRPGVKRLPAAALLSTSADAGADAAAPSAADIPDADGKRAISPEIQELADRIASLNMIQSTDLVNALSEKLGVSADAFFAGGGGFAAGPAAAGGAAPAAADASGGAAAGAADGAPASEVTLQLTSIEEGAKFKVLKEVRKLKPDMPLIECKKLVEKLPAALKEAVPREEAETIAKAIKEVGGVVELV